MAKSYWGLRDSCGYGGSTRAQLALAILADTALIRISTITDLPPRLVLEWMRHLRDGKLTPSPTCPSPGKVASAKAEMWPLRQTNGHATRQPSSVRTDGGFYMSANIIRLLPDEERALLECYVTGSDQPASFQQPTRWRSPPTQCRIAPDSGRADTAAPCPGQLAAMGRDIRTTAIHSAPALLDPLGDQRPRL